MIVVAIDPGESIGMVTRIGTKVYGATITTPLDSDACGIDYTQLNPISSSLRNLPFGKALRTSS